MRYLLEVLEDDRARFPDLRQVYAFAPASSEAEDTESAMWAAKGIEPILYSSSNASDHTALYSSLRAWRDYAVAPGKWRKERLRELLAKVPGKGTDTSLLSWAPWRRLRNGGQCLRRTRNSGNVKMHCGLG